MFCLWFESAVAPLSALVQLRRRSLNTSSVFEVIRPLTALWPAGRLRRWLWCRRGGVHRRVHLHVPPPLDTKWIRSHLAAPAHQTWLLFPSGGESRGGSGEKRLSHGALSSCKRIKKKGNRAIFKRTAWAILHWHHDQRAWWELGARRSEVRMLLSEDALLSPATMMRMLLFLLHFRAFHISILPIYTIRCNYNLPMCPRTIPSMSSERSITPQPAV